MAHCERNVNFFHNAPLSTASKSSFKNLKVQLGNLYLTFKEIKKEFLYLFKELENILKILLMQLYGDNHHLEIYLDISMCLKIAKIKSLLQF